MWSRSAIAPIVRERGLGLCVESLRDLPQALAAVTPEQYAAMRSAALAAGAEAAAGANLRALLARLGFSA